MVDAALQHDIEQFLYREVRLLSERRYEEWLDLFTDDAVYWMPARETIEGQPDGLAGEGEMALYEDDKVFLAARIERLRSSLAHVERAALWAVWAIRPALIFDPLPGLVLDVEHVRDL